MKVPWVEAITPNLLEEGVVFAQRKYAIDILEVTGLENCKSIDSPMDLNQKLMVDQGSIADRRSTSQYCPFLLGNLVTWRSKKQSIVVKQGILAESHIRKVFQENGCTNSRCDSSQSRKLAVLFYELLPKHFLEKDQLTTHSLQQTFHFPLKRPVEFSMLYSDNMVIINTDHNPIRHDLAKYIETDRQFIEEKLEEGLMSTLSELTTQKVVDI
ncbi:hypothetical protein V8G54_030123 [Vigna mungo]|uniref:Mitochondrial protein n=1 Tax=Vigna mungo TaxID=3915 RepID=A0AAQ3MVP3_VIGMU